MLEYRVPGSWLLRAPACFMLGADICRKAYKMGLLVDGREWDGLPSSNSLITACDADAACAIIAAHKPFYTDFLRGMYGEPNATRTLAIALNGGLAAAIKWGSVAEEWQLGISRYNPIYFYSSLPSTYRWGSTISRATSR